MSKDSKKSNSRQEVEHRSSYLADRYFVHLKPLLVKLKAQMDRRLVGTFLGLGMAILMHRHRNHGLLLSELGGYLMEPNQAPAGTKRIQRLLYSEKWCSRDIEEYLWEQADQRVEDLWSAEKLVLAIWDESVIEKPESLHLEGLCPVKSSKAKRLKRIKPGFFNPPGGRPIFVPGYHWLQVLVLGMQSAPTLAHFRWWTTRGEAATDKRSQEKEVLCEITRRWGIHQVLHVWDRGFAGQPWLTQAYVHGVRFVMRWPKRYKLVDEQQRLRKAWEISRGKRSWQHRYLWDARRRCYRKVGVIAFPVFDGSFHQPLWLVVARPGLGRSPWYLLTNQPVHSPDQAWPIVLAYARRWQIEMSIRFDKCELAFESPRLRRWETQLRLLLIATLVYSFLLSLLNPDPVGTLSWLLRNWCHRTGEWSRKVQAPLYRLRSAISRFWLSHPPPFLRSLRLSSG